MHPTYHLLRDIARAGTIEVRLEAAMNTEGGIVELCVLIHDPASGEDLFWPLPRAGAFHTPHELELAAGLWCLILDGNADRLPSP